MYVAIQHIAEMIRVHAFLKGISPKTNVIAQLEFKLAYDNRTVQHISHSSMGTPPP